MSLSPKIQAEKERLKDAMALRPYWESVERAILANAGPTQRQEMRRAFYLGAASYMEIMQKAAMRELSEEQGAQLIADLLLEIEQFATLVMARAA